MLIESPILPKSLSLITDTTGYFKTESGLGKGLYKITVSADGFATLKKEVNVTGSGIVTTNFSLTPGGGSISTVSRAVALVGFAGIRNMALSLVLLEHTDVGAAVASSSSRVVRLASDDDEEIERRFVAGAFPAEIERRLGIAERVRFLGAEVVPVIDSSNTTDYAAAVVQNAFDDVRRDLQSLRKFSIFGREIPDFLIT